MSFHNIRLDLGYDYGADGGHSWSSSVVETAGGGEVANQNWAHWKGRWQLGNRNIDKAQLDVLRSFHAGRRGRVYGFRFKDWNDWLATDELLTVSGATTQLVKTYEPAGPNPYVRTISLPVAATVQVTQDGAAYTDFTVSDSTGLITWTAGAPTGVIRWSGEFDVPARFDVELIPAVFLAYEERDEGPQAIYQMGSVNVVERR